MVQILLILILIFLNFSLIYTQIFPMGSAPLYSNQIQWPSSNGVGGGGGYFSVLTPNYQQQPQQQQPYLPQQLIVPYGSNTLWPFPQQQQQPAISSSYSTDDRGNLNFIGGGNPPLPRSAFQQQQQSPLNFYAGWPQQQQFPQQRDNSSPLNELISQLSLALVRSFAQMLAQRDNTNNDSSSSGGGGGLIRTPREGGGFLGIPFGQPPQQQQPAPSFPGRVSTNYGYGVNAGVFAGTYGGSESVASPYGPYGSLNSQTGGGSYSGLSPWPLIPGRPQPPLQPSTNGGNSSTGGGLLRLEETARTGQGTIRQIPLTENVQTEAGGGGGGQQQHEGSGETV
uniref:Uncharacterized protein n=1 Tax=Meloidogyne enterolobii TaxID=390850 RepID=A0A6V7UXH4_MELEN|nr:unnamed protein product [Meloidogyne enterolobii]